MPLLLLEAKCIPNRSVTELVNTEQRLKTPKASNGIIFLGKLIPNCKYMYFPHINACFKARQL